MMRRGPRLLSAALLLGLLPGLLALTVGPARAPLETTLTEVRLPVASGTVWAVASVPSTETGADVEDFRSAFPLRTLEAKDGAITLEVGQEPVYVLDGDTSLSRRPCPRSRRRSASIRHWQFENEPDIASEDTEGYAHLYEVTYDAIREAYPEAKVPLGGQTGGGIPVFERFFVPVLKKLGGKRVDIYDIHYYGDAKMAWRGVKTDYDHIRKRLDELGYARTEIWITEMGTYSGAPGDEEPRRRPPQTERERQRERDLGQIPEPPRLKLPPQSEREQAWDVVKRHAYTLSIGVKKTFWAFGLVEGFQHDDGFFDHTGFIYDGEFDNDPRHGTTKLAYHAYRMMTETLDGADWSRAERLPLGKEVYAIRVPRGKGTVTVVWLDPPDPISALVSPDALKEIRRRLVELGHRTTDAEHLRERLGALREIIRLALDAGGPSAVDGWAPFDRVKRLEKRVLDHDVAAPAELDAMIRDARDAFR